MAPLIEIEHIIDAAQGFKRPLREGRETIKNIICVGVTKKSATEVEVEALCVRTSELSGDPAKIELTVNKSAKAVEERIKKISCSCTAGSSKEHLCKHAMAVLSQLERLDENDVEEFTCTDLEQKWGKLKGETLSQFEPAPLVEYCCVTPYESPYRRKEKEVDDSMTLRFRNRFLLDRPQNEGALLVSKSRYKPPERQEEGTNNLQNILHSVVSQSISKSNFILKRTQELCENLYLECSKDEKQYYDKFVVLSEEEASTLCLNTVGQCNKHWEKARYGKVTGSNCYSMYTYSKNKQPNWTKKLKNIYESDFQGNKHTERGLMYENDAKVCYERQNKNTNILTPGIFVNPVVPWLGYSADGLIYEEKEVKRLWECKTPAAGKKQTAANICSSLNYMVDGKLKQKHPYYGQVQLGLILMSLDSCDFTLFCYGSDEIYVDHVTLNERFCSDMLEALANVYFKQILPWLCKQS